jgi:predicted GTPase
MSDGAKSLNNLKEGDTVLISEGCTHHRQCEDIGTVKLPKWISGYTKKELNFEFTSGGEFPGDLSRYSLIVHCGACMLNEKEVAYRIESAQRAGIPITNYGILIAYIHGILERAVKLFNI